MSDLFRQEAIDHQRSRFYGTILLQQPRSQTLWTLLLCALLGAVLVLACVVGFERQESLPGVLVPQAGLQRLRAPAGGGTVMQVQATRGQAVSAGMPLLHIVDATTAATHTLRAERDGRLIDLLVQPGDAVSAGQLLGLVAPPDGGLEVELYAPTRLVALINTGTALSIHFNGVAQAASARVRDRSATAIPAGEFKLPVDATPGANAVYRVRATLASQQVTDRAGRAVVLAPGMDVTAQLLGERRTLLEWIVEPLRAQPKDTR